MKKIFILRAAAMLMICSLIIALPPGREAIADGVKSDFTGKGAGYAAVLYDNSNGLPTSEANAVLQTEDGFIWIGSYSGLIRYDGSEFYRYDASLGISSVVSLYEDSRHRLWIGTNDNGVALYSDGEFRFYDKVEGLKSSSIRAVSEDSQGNILIATTQGMAYVDSDDELHSLDDPQLNSEYICELKSDRNGVIYGETISGAFFSIENMRVSAYYSGVDLGLGVISTVFPDPVKDGYVYLGTEESGLYYADMAGGMRNITKSSVAPHSNINNILSVEGKLWICADNGIGFMDSGMNYNPLSDIPMNNSVDDMIADHEGNLWFASSRQGVMKIVPCEFTDISKLAGLEPLVVNTNVIYGDDLYVGTDTGLYIIGNDYKTKTNELTELLKGIRIRSIKKDSKGDLWFCTYSSIGLVCFKSDGSYTTFNEENGLTSNRVRTIDELSDGTMILSTSGGMHFIRDGQVSAAFGSERGISNTEILSMCEGENGVLYLCSDGDGLYKVSGNNVTRLGRDDGLRSEVILKIKKDEKRGIYWLITSNSIAYMKDDKITTIENFPYSNNFDIFFDENGNAWIMSSNGIYVTNADSLMENGEIEYILYDSKAGLPVVATANSHSCLAEDGTLYIAGTTGISSVNIDTAQNSPSDIRLEIPYISADDRLIFAGEDGDFTVPSGTKRLTIHAHAITYSLHDPKIRYKLEGFDDEAQEILKQDMQPVTYTNLDGGTYEFRLSTVNTLTGEEEHYITVGITKTRALYEQVWFWIAIGLMAAALVILLVREYMRRKTAALVKREKEKEEFIDEIITAFATCIDVKDKYTKGHSFRVAEYSKLLAQKLGYDDDMVKNVYNIALLHDIGKISIPDDILNKPGRPTDEEYETLKTHPQKGYDILQNIKIAPDLALGAGYHHERMDGKGYPGGLKGDEIPYVAQIIAVADTFDAMYSTRPYRKQMDIKDVKAEMERVSGTQLNADIVKLLTELIDEGKIGNQKL